MSYNIKGGAAGSDPQYTQLAAGVGSNPRLLVFSNTAYVLADGTGFTYKAAGGAWTATTYAALGMPANIKIRYAFTTAGGIVVGTSKGVEYTISNPTTAGLTTVLNWLDLTLENITVLADGSRLAVMAFSPTYTVGRQLQPRVFYGTSVANVAEIDLAPLALTDGDHGHTYALKLNTDHIMLGYYQYRTYGTPDALTNRYQFVGLDLNALTGAIVKLGGTYTRKRPLRPTVIAGVMNFASDTAIMAYDGVTYTSPTPVHTVDLEQCTSSGGVDVATVGYMTPTDSHITTDGITFNTVARFVAGYTTDYEIILSGYGTPSVATGPALMRLTEHHLPAGMFTYLASDLTKLDKFKITDATDTELEMHIAKLDLVGGAAIIYVKAPSITTAGTLTLKLKLAETTVRTLTDPFEGLYQFVMDGNAAGKRNIVDNRLPLEIDAITPLEGTTVGDASNSVAIQWGLNIPYPNQTTMSFIMFFNTSYAASVGVTNMLLMQVDNAGGGEYFGLFAEDSDRCDYYGSVGSSPTWFLQNTPFTLNTDIVFGATGDGSSKQLVYQGTNIYTAAGSIGSLANDSTAGRIAVASLRGDLYQARFGYQLAGGDVLLAEELNMKEADTVTINQLNVIAGIPPTSSSPYVDGIYPLKVTGYGTPSGDIDTVFVINESHLPDRFWNWVTAGNDRSGLYILKDSLGNPLPTREIMVDPTKRQIELQARVTISSTGTTYFTLSVEVGNVPSSVGLYTGLYEFVYSERDPTHRNLVDDVVGTLTGVAKASNERYLGDSTLSWPLVSLNGATKLSMSFAGSIFRGGSPNSLLTVVDDVSAQTQHCTLGLYLAQYIGNHTSATSGWSYIGSGTHRTGHGDWMCANARFNHGANRKLLYKGDSFLSGTGSIPTLSNSGGVILFGRTPSAELFNGYGGHARVSIQNETVITDDLLKFEAYNLMGSLQVDDIAVP